jgi:hypothetical protein
MPVCLWEMAKILNSGRMVGDVSFRDRFHRLFELSLLKDQYVFGMHLLGWRNEGGLGVGGVGYSRGRRRW